MSPQWVFDPTPPSGARSGGDIAERAFRPEISVFVREVLQNAKDQHLSAGEPVSVLFHLAEIKGSELQSFLEALQWPQLKPHLEAASGQPNGQSLKPALRSIQHDQKLLLLAVHDGHTTGLLGGETGGGNFAALCRDRLFSEKSEQSAGGSHGLGKAVLWRFSSLSTVAFCSSLSDLPPGSDNPRFISRTNLPWHKVGSEQFAGDGWLGRPSQVEGGTRAESLWGPEAGALAQRLGVGRMKAFGTGTSILVMGFQEPADESRPASEMVASIASAAADSFWPSLRTESGLTSKGGPAALRVRVRLNDSDEESVADFNPVDAFVEALERHREGRLSASLERPGDVISVPLSVHLPAAVSTAHKALVAEAALIIRLAEPNPQTAHLNTVACIRGAGMVVEYRPFERLSITARPFHALLLCGLARNPRGITPEDEALERFLRSAEPPEHDKWISTVRLKEQYKPGYKKALEELFDQVRAKLREAVAERIKVGTAGPELLAKKFPIGPSEGGTKPKQPFHFRSLRGELTEEGAWRFSGEARADEAVPDGWEVTVDLRFGGEGRGRDSGGLIRHFAIDQEKAPNATCRMEDGRAVVQLPPQVARFSFMGESDPARHPVDAQLSVSELVLESRRVKGKR